MKTIRGPKCPNCKVCDDWHKYSTFATCINCNYEREIKKRAPAKATVATDHGMMTPAQAKEFERAKAWIFQYDSHGRPENYEFKQIVVQPSSGSSINVHTVVGRKGDEGTMAEIFARTRRMFLISDHGGLYNFIKGASGKSIKVSGFFDTLINSDMDRDEQKRLAAEAKTKGAGKAGARPRTPNKLAAQLNKLLRK